MLWQFPVRFEQRFSLAPELFNLALCVREKVVWISSSYFTPPHAVLTFAEPIKQLLRTLIPAPMSVTADMDGSMSLNALQSFRNHSAFQYQQLPHTDSIRLVSICSVYPEVTCKITTVRLQDSPQYEALSYCWGASGKQASITCDGASFDLSLTLKDAFRQLHRYKKTGSFWVDQICINQQDGTECTRQVRLMNAIYQQSIRTLIWLPLDNENAIAAKSLILHTWDYLKADTKIKAMQGRDTAENERTNDSTSSSRLPMDGDERWIALNRLLEMPWFKRCWVIQEVALSSRSPTILCGTQLFQWSYFEKVTRWFYHHPQETGFVGRAYFIDRIGIIGEKEDWNDGSNDITWELQALLQLTHWFRATDPRDRIIALLGLCRETRQPAHWPSELDPDYNKSFHDFFTGVTRYCMRESANLNILHIVDSSVINHTQSAEFPSWVPRWDAPSEVWTSTGTHTTWIYSTWKALKDQHNDASDGRFPVIDDSTAPSILRILGIHISPARYLCPVVSYDDVFEPSSNAVRSRKTFQLEILKMWEICKARLPNMSTAELHRAFFMTTCMGQTPEATDALDEPLTHFEAYLGLPLQNNNQETIEDTLDTLSMTRPVNSSSGELNPPDPSRYAIRLEVMINRCLFITATGNLGLGPATMAVDDVVVILFGGNVPYLLRPLKNGQWRFVGECYVHGIIRGEVLQDDRADERDRVWFELV